MFFLRDRSKEKDGLTDHIKRYNANKHKNAKYDDSEDETDILDFLEIAVKSTRLDVKDMLAVLKEILKEVPAIVELKQEIKELKAELREEKLFNRRLIEKYVDKTPVAQSAADKLAAIRAANDTAVKPSGMAAVDKAANKN